MEKPIEQTLVILVKSLDEDRNEEVIEKIKLIGATAAFFEGFQGMKKLHDAAEALVEKDNSVGSRLNGLWDGIGGWVM